MGQPAARISDMTAHGSPLAPGPGCPTVLIGGMPAARVGDMAACGAPIVVGAPTVLIGG